MNGASKWRFPEIGVPPVIILIFMGFSQTKTFQLGTSFQETFKWIEKWMVYHEKFPLEWIVDGLFIIKNPHLNLMILGNFQA